MAVMVCPLEACGHPIIRHDEQGRCWATGCIDENHWPCTSSDPVDSPGHAAADTVPAAVLLASIRAGAAAKKAQEDMDRAVHHPDHYRAYYPGGPTCIEVTGWFNFNLGNATKYIWRAGRKTPDAIEDLRKAQKYIEFELDRLTKEKDA
jgi:hypothetical protein